jgi:hypothetical protein
VSGRGQIQDGDRRSLDGDGRTLPADYQTGLSSCPKSISLSVIELPEWGDIFLLLSICASEQPWAEEAMFLSRV